ncbi:MAG: hypothetical protein LBT82_00550 [Oscillospiraceae bacterium]|nr:hypothetical protein [Oscillospiraceae bacterium]
MKAVLTWCDHYVRCYLGDFKEDSGRCPSKRIMNGFCSGWYRAGANSNGRCSYGTGYAFYGK